MFFPTSNARFTYFTVTTNKIRFWNMATTVFTKSDVLIITFVRFVC